MVIIGNLLGTKLIHFSAIGIGCATLNAQNNGIGVFHITATDLHYVVFRLFRHFCGDSLKINKKLIRALFRLKMRFLKPNYTDDTGKID